MWPGRRKNIDRSFVADHSALTDGIGAPTPTNSGQDSALRIVDRLGDRHVDGETIRSPDRIISKDSDNFKYQHLRQKTSK